MFDHETGEYENSRLFPNEFEYHQVWANIHECHKKYRKNL